MPPRVNGGAPTASGSATRTPAAGPPRTTSAEPARQAIDRDTLPAGSGTIDEPDTNDDIEETLEAFRQLNGEADAAVASAPPPQDPDPIEDQVPEDEPSFGFPGEQPEEGQRAAPVEEPQPPEEPVVPAPPAAQPEPAQPVQAQVPVAQAPDPAGAFQQMSEQLEQNLALFQTELANKVYQVSDADLEALNTNPKEVYAKMLARVHINAVSSVMRTVAQQMPVVINGMLAAQRRNDMAQDRFWKAFPQLDKTNPTHMQTVSTIARNVRAMNPNMAENDMARFTAAQAIVMLGLQPGAAAAPPRRSPPQMPGRQVRTTPAPYAPAAARAAPGTPQRPQRNQWDLMTSLIEMGDSGRFDPPT